MPQPLTDLKDVNSTYHKSLERADIDTLEKLCALTMKEVGRKKGIGGTGIAELIRALSDLDLQFSQEA